MMKDMKKKRLVPYRNAAEPKNADRAMQRIFFRWKTRAVRMGIVNGGIE